MGEIIILQNKDGKIMANSREVAEKFEKAHKNVLQAIHNLMAEKSAVKNMFVESTYISSRGREENEYLMDRDGFSLLVMGFTGKKALEWKLKYIEAFNAMEEKLKSGTQLTEEERLKLQLFSKDPMEVASAHNKLVELATTPLISEIETLRPDAEYAKDVLGKDDLINMSLIANSLGMEAAKLNKIMNKNGIIYKRPGHKYWSPYKNYLWLITEGYAGYQSYPKKGTSPYLKWTERGRKWIVENHKEWCKNAEME